jgi:(1->4)-alpha-D-glucan 1-alpha-D-glucosylmutase
MQKAMREAKVTTSWTEPNTAHEKAVEDFIARILTPTHDNAFLPDFLPFQKRIAHLGLLNSLSQTVLKLTSPGVPDTYQGTELWDFSLVDPDNRRPVEYAHRRRVIEDLHALQNAHRENLAAMATDLLLQKENGHIKFWITQILLHARRDHPGLFTRGDYVPLEASGPKANHVFAFARVHGNLAAIIIVPRLLATLIQGNDLPLGNSVWSDTEIPLPEPLAGRSFRNLFTGTTTQSLVARDIFAHLSVAVLLTSD